MRAWAEYCPARLVSPTVGPDVAKAPSCSTLTRAPEIGRRVSASITNPRTVPVEVACIPLVSGAGVASGRVAAAATLVSSESESERQKGARTRRALRRRARDPGPRFPGEWKRADCMVILRVGKLPPDLDKLRGPAGILY